MLCRIVRFWTLKAEVMILGLIRGRKDYDDQAIGNATDAVFIQPIYALISYLFTALSPLGVVQILKYPRTDSSLALSTSKNVC